MKLRPGLICLALFCSSFATAFCQDSYVKIGKAVLKRTVVDANLPGAYQVEIADVNGDKKPDIVALGGGTVAWYENPTWQKRIVSDKQTTPGVISTATRDIDGDGKAEIAIAYEFEMNNPKLGKLLLARQTANGWSYEPMGNFPSIHRLRWGDFDGDGKADLVVAPIFGPGTMPPAFQGEGARLKVLFSGKMEEGEFNPRNMVTPSLPVMHAVGVVRLYETNRDHLLSASNAGVYVHRFFPEGKNPSWGTKILTTGAEGERPKTGASEIHLGRMKDGRTFITSLEPWHGSDVTVYLSDGTVPNPDDRTDADTVRMPKFGKRQVLDQTLKDGHALCVADVDGDGTDEIFAGYRGPGTSVHGYHYSGGEWKKTIVDSKIAAQDLRSGDINGDGLADVVSVGGSTRNVVLYESILNP